MYKSNVLRALALTGLLLASAPSMASEPAPTLQSNGIKFQGTFFNGIFFNGRRLNGRGFNGLSLNGKRFNGFKINGLRMNGNDLSPIRLPNVSEQDAAQVKLMLAPRTPLHVNNTLVLKGSRLILE